MTGARLDLVLVLALTFTTGVVDAVGYLGLDNVFTANMTGNVIVLGMGLAGAPGLPVLGPAVALAGFLVGAALGGRLLHTAAPGWTPRATGTFTTSGVLVVLLGLGAVVAEPHAGTVWGTTVVALLAVAMGLQAASARKVAVKDVTTVVVTSTLTGLAADSRLAGGGDDRWPRRVLAVALLVAGAGLGALLLRADDDGIGIGMLVAGVLALVVAVVGGSRRTRRAD